MILKQEIISKPKYTQVFGLQNLSYIFQEILSITQMLSKHQITTDKIYFNESNEITLYFDNIRAKLGKDNLEEKVMRLEQILPNLSGESGVLDLQNYSEDRKNVTFQKDG